MICCRDLCWQLPTPRLLFSFFVSGLLASSLVRSSYFASMSLALLLLACGSGLPTGAKAAKEASRPNLLFMMADQLRADAQGADARFGGAPNTPNLDKLAAEGLRFTNSYSST